MVARANAHVRYPARFQLVAAMNPCRCGYLDDPQQCCSRAPVCAADYQSKISGPLFDRIDIAIDVPAVSPSDLSLPPPSENSAAVALRVGLARDLQRKRFAGYMTNAMMNEGRRVRTNADADGALLEEIAAPDADGRKLLTDAAERMKLTARGYHRVLRVARTLADLDGSAEVRRIHIAEAVSYRRTVPGRQGALAR